MPAPRSAKLQLVALLSALTCFCLLPPDILALAPRLCLWRQLFHLSACPACGSARALAAFFHGRFSEAVASNRNVIVTAPLLLALTAGDISRFFRSCRSSRIL